VHFSSNTSDGDANAAFAGPEFNGNQDFKLPNEFADSVANANHASDHLSRVGVYGNQLADIVTMASTNDVSVQHTVSEINNLFKK